MVTYIAHDTWAGQARPANLDPFDPSRLRGLAVHWTGSSQPFGDVAPLALSVKRLKAELKDHLGRGWKWIGYTAAVDQAGRVFELRGVHARSAANGDQNVNLTHGAVTFLIGQGDTPTPAAIDAFLAWRRAIWLKAWPHATGIVGHRDLHPTECPGPALYRLVTTGRLAPPNTRPEEPVPITDDDVERIARRAAELVTGIGAVHPVVVADGTGQAKLPDGRSIDAVPTVLAELQAALTRIEQRLGAAG